MYFIINTEGNDFPCSLLGAPDMIQNMNACINPTSNLGWGVLLWGGTSSDFYPFVLLSLVQFTSLKSPNKDIQ